jgi:protein-disulfide isomerase
MSSRVSEKQSKRIRLLAAALGGAAILVVALVLISRSGDDAATNAPKAADLNATAARVNRSLADIPQRGAVLGDPKAPVTLIEFVDLQCPYCGYIATKGSVPEVVDRYVSTGKVKVELHVLSGLGPDSVRAAAVAAAAAEQDKLWQFVDLSFYNQGVENSGYVTDSYLRSIATRVRGLDAAKALSDAKGAKAKAQVATWARDRDGMDVQGTPSFFLKRGDGPPRKLNITDLDDVSIFSRPIDRALAG